MAPPNRSMVLDLPVNTARVIILMIFAAELTACVRHTQLRTDHGSQVLVASSETDPDLFYPATVTALTDAAVTVSFGPSYKVSGPGINWCSHNLFGPGLNDPCHGPPSAVCHIGQVAEEPTSS